MGLLDCYGNLLQLIPNNLIIRTLERISDVAWTIKVPLGVISISYRFIYIILIVLV